MQDESKKGRGDTDINLSVEQYGDLKRALQWPEDLANYDRISRPTNLSEIGISYSIKSGE